jgi:hypothetical protein
VLEDKIHINKKKRKLKNRKFKAKETSGKNCSESHSPPGACPRVSERPPTKKIDDRNEAARSSRKRRRKAKESHTARKKRLIQFSVEQQASRVSCNISETSFSDKAENVN